MSKTWMAAWGVWILSFVPLGIAIAVRPELGAYLVLSGLTVVINLALIAFVLRRMA